jgi:hypothetical protein
MDGTALACQSRSSETRAGIVALMGCGGVYDSTLYEDNGMEHLHRKEQFIGKDFGISEDDILGIIEGGVSLFHDLLFKRPMGESRSDVFELAGVIPDRVENRMLVIETALQNGFMERDAALTVQKAFFMAWVDSLDYKPDWLERIVSQI